MKINANSNFLNPLPNFIIELLIVPFGLKVLKSVRL